MSLRRLFASFLLAAVVLGVFNAQGLLRWSRDVRPAALADALVPLAEGWDAATASLGLDRPYALLREGVTALRHKE
jgi:hypothetical protein